jgi:hypothetical protein
VATEAVTEVRKSRKKKIVEFSSEVSFDVNANANKSGEKGEACGKVSKVGQTVASFGQS